MTQKFLISIERQSKRRQIALDRFAQVGIDDITWWKAIDAQTDELTMFPIDTNKFHRMWLSFGFCCSFDRVYSKSEYACASSHMSIYKHMVDNNIDYALILEDDVYPREEIVELINNASSVMQKYGMDILYLDFEDKLRSFSNKTFNECGVEIKQVGVPGFDWLFNRRKIIYLASAYVLSKRGAEKLMHKGLPIRMTADMLTGLLSYTKLKAYRTTNKYFVNEDIGTDILHHFEMPENDRTGLRLLALKFKLLVKKLVGRE